MEDALVLERGAPAAKAETSAAVHTTDIAIVGGGLAGSLAAAMLGRAAVDAVLIDPRPQYPTDFRCEKLDGDQVAILKKTGLAEAVLRASTPDGVSWVARMGRTVDKRPGDQAGIYYAPLVNTVRAEIPPGVRFLEARATALKTGEATQSVAISTGETVNARLIVLANGLNIGLREQLGLTREILNPCHSISIGFDVRPLDRPAFDFPALTYYAERPSDRTALITLFPIGQAMRANLFVYRDMNDPWLGAMRANPQAALYALMPKLRPLLGEFAVEGHLKIRPVDLYVTRGHLQSGVVLVGDAFSTSCPAAGTGVRKVLTDVERLCNVHIPQWLATPGMGIDKIARFYDDPVKRACDVFSFDKAHALKAFSIDESLPWRVRRLAKFAAHYGRGRLRALSRRRRGATRNVALAGRRVVTPPAEFSLTRAQDLGAALQPGRAAAHWRAGAFDLLVYDNLQAAEADWRQFQQTACCTPFQTFDWLDAWQRHIGARNGVTPRIVVMRDAGGAILCILPLSLRQAGIARELCFLGSDLCDYNAPLLAPDFSQRVDAETFLDLWRDALALLQAHAGFDMVRLEKMPEAVRNQHNPLMALSTRLHPSGSYATPLAESWDAFYAAKRSPATRRRDRSKRNRLAEAGEVAFVTAEHGVAALESLDVLIAQKSAFFAKRGISNLFEREGYVDFLRDLAVNRPELVHVSRLQVGDEAVAANFGLTLGGRYYYLLSSYTDGELARLGPGAAHLHELMRYAIKRDFTMFDFTVGDELYKSDWCETVQPLYDHVAVATWRGRVAAAPALVLKKAKRTIKQTPVLWACFRKARAVGGRVVARVLRREPPGSSETRFSRGGKSPRPC